MIENDWIIRLSLCKYQTILRNQRSTNYENQRIKFLKFTLQLNNQQLSHQSLDLRIQLQNQSLTTITVTQNLFKQHNSKYQKWFKFKVTTGMNQLRVKNLNRLLLQEKKSNTMKVWNKILRARYQILIWLENETKVKKSMKVSLRILKFKKFYLKQLLSIKMTLLK